MGRLIDADTVIKAVDRHTKDESEIVLDNDITCILEEVPTAYDVEKVVAELYEIKGHYGYYGSEESEYVSYESAIDIVKRGGVK